MATKGDVIYIALLLEIVKTMSSALDLCVRKPFWRNKCAVVSKIITLEIPPLRLRIPQLKNITHLLVPFVQHSQPVKGTFSPVGKRRISSQEEFWPFSSHSFSVYTSRNI